MRLTWYEQAQAIAVIHYWNRTIPIGKTSVISATPTRAHWFINFHSPAFYSILISGSCSYLRPTGWHEYTTAHAQNGNVLILIYWPSMTGIGLRPCEGFITELSRLLRWSFDHRRDLGWNFLARAWNSIKKPYDDQIHYLTPCRERK